MLYDRASAWLQDFLLETRAAGADFTWIPGCCPAFTGVLAGQISQVHQHHMHNNERIIRRTKHALSWLDFHLNRSSGSHQLRSSVERAQRTLKETQDAALHQKTLQKHARRARQQRGARKWLHADSRGTREDDPIMPIGADNEKTWALESRPRHRHFHPRAAC